MLRGSKQTGKMRLVNLAEQASNLHDPLLLPFLSGMADLLDDPVMVTASENAGQG